MDIFQTHSGVIYLMLISTCLLHSISFTRSTVEFSHTLLNGVRQLLPEVTNLTNVYYNCHYHTIPIIFLEDSQFSCEGLEVNGSLWQRFYLVQLQEQYQHKQLRQQDYYLTLSTFHSTQAIVMKHYNTLMKHFRPFIMKSKYFKIWNQRSISIYPNYILYFTFPNQSNFLEQQTTIILNNLSDYISILQRMHFMLQTNEMNIYK